MSRRHVLKKYQVLDNADSTTNPISKETDVSQLDFVTYQLNVEAGVTATLLVLFSNDERFDPANASELNFGTPVVLDGATNADYVLHIQNQGFKWLYLNVIDVGGNGNVNAWVTGNVRGA